MSDPTTLAERALAAAGEETALARVIVERSLLLRFARSRPTQATSIDDATIEICVVRDGQLGRAETNAGDDEALRRCAREARAAAEAAARGGHGDYPGFPTPVAALGDGRDAATARLDPRSGGAALATAFDVCARHGVEAHGVWTAADVETAVAASGQVARERVTDAFMKVTAIASGGRSGYASATAAAVEAVDARSLAEAAAAKASFATEPVRLEPGDYPVVLEPPAVGELVEWLGSTALNGLQHVEGRGALSDRLGSRVTAAGVNIADAPHHPRTLPHAFDAEGVPKRPLPMIEDGVARHVAHDTRTAALAGTRSTGHALVPGGSSNGPEPTNLVLAGGGASGYEELCAPIERGIYVTRLWYTNPVRPKETLITGVTRDGTFLIEGGEVTRPAHDLRLTDSVLRVFDCMEDMTAETVLASGGEFYGRRFATGVVCPGMRTRMRFTA
jgi:PmbA protein